MQLMIAYSTVVISQLDLSSMMVLLPICCTQEEIMIGELHPPAHVDQLLSSCRITQVNLICDKTADEPTATALGDSFDRLLFYVRTHACYTLIDMHIIDYIQQFDVRTKCACPGECSGRLRGGAAADDVG